MIRRRYEFRQRLVPESVEDEKTRRDSKPHSRLFRPAKYLQQRIRDNQKQKSFLALTKWAVCDAKKFDEKVRRLKNLIDGLEDISKAAGITQFQCSQQNLTDPAPILIDNPPPYSVEAPVERPFRQAQPILVPSPPAINSIPVPDVGLFEQYISLRRYATSLQADAPLRHRAREKLSTLNDGQLKELRVDVYDELCRRRQTGTPPPFLLPVDIYHVKRNQARENISTLPWYRFAHLVTDLVFELEKRFAPLKSGIESVNQSISVPDALTYTFARRNPREGNVLSDESRPPIIPELQHLNLAPLNRTPYDYWQHVPRQCRHSQTSTTLGQAGGPTSSNPLIEGFQDVRQNPSQLPRPSSLFTSSC